MQKQLEKERENEQKAQQKYKSWLKKKNQEKMELEKKEKVRWTSLFLVLLSTMHLSTTLQYLQENQIRCFSFFSGQEKAALKEEQDRERRKRAEEKFKEWLAKANEKSRDAPKTPCSSTSRHILHVQKILEIYERMSHAKNKQIPFYSQISKIN